MIWMRGIALVIGYIFGLFQTGFIVGKAKGVDIREHGSGNSGTTNTLRVLGQKAGVITFIGDTAKSILAILVVRWIFKDQFQGDIAILGLYGGFGAVLGHNYPFYMNFKGGKGIACTAGLILTICPLSAPLCLVGFALPIILTKYVSLGSVIMSILFMIQTVLYNHLGWLHVSEEARLEYDILILILGVLAIYRHKANIVRLINGTENKIGQKAK
ncbi:MAG: glycerol-3-phosphate 1-O-acyltransferase PlsY [Agathobacter sp.]|nr:glycerol-3-phosphate 1-O-acyltransferase PlsY [Agathobacter sp.]